MTEQQPDQQRAERLEDELLAALDLIRQHWPTLLTPTTRPSTGSPSTDTLTSTERRILLRQQVDHALARWCRVIARERTLTTRLPLATDTLGMIVLVERWARWFTAEHADAARATRQLGTLGQAVKHTVDPPARDHVYLGRCPFVLPDPEGTLDRDGRSLLWPCQGRILTRIGGDGSAYCTGCGQEAVREWWEHVLQIRLPYVTLPGLVPILHARLGLRVTDRHLRRWRRDGIITPALEPADHAPVPWPPFTGPGIGPLLVWDLFDPLEVVAVLAERERVCALCGTAWDGGGDICRSCWVATVQANPTIAEPRPTVHAPHRLPRPPRKDTPNTA